MSKITGKYTNIAIGELSNVDVGESLPPNNTVLVFNNQSENFELKARGLVSTTRVIRQNFVIEEDEFLILKCPRIDPNIQLKVEGQLKVV